MENRPSPGGEFLLFPSEDGGAQLEVRLVHETVWLSLDQMSELFQRDKSVISRHINNIFSEGELTRDRTVAEFATVQYEGQREIRRDITFYNLDVIISTGYRVKSHRGTQFRIWATERLREYLIKGFTMNDDLLKRGGGGNYFEELLLRIRDIRSSEKVFWKQVLDIFATSIDYDRTTEAARQFFATIQNKMHYAAHGHTAAEVVFERADSTLPNMGMKSWVGSRPTKAESVVAKNYLNEDELVVLNRIVSLCLDFAELQAMGRKPIYMSDWLRKIDDFLTLSDRDVLETAGTISQLEAQQKAHQEYDRYRLRRSNEPSQVERDFDESIRAIKRIERKTREQSND